jgi:protein phosphatase
MFLEQICISHIGNRANHEDNYLFSGMYITHAVQKEMPVKRFSQCEEKSHGNVRLYAVSDGMGGHNSGEMASYITVSKLAELEKTVQNCTNIKTVVEICQKAITDINYDICAKSRGSSALRGMGATLVLFIICGSECAVINIGDSRAYFFNNTNLSQITKDNTEGQRMFDLKLLTAEELLKFPARKNLSRYIGFDEQGLQLKGDEYFFKSQNGFIILCSDGVSDSLTDSQLENYLKADLNIKTSADNIIKRAVEQKGSDNATIIIVTIKG